ncbi:MAG TPA: histidine kinase [Chitinophagaceae bacterium]|nr:histidine kinase [Chitinophagaceae bacterium]
MKRVSLHIIFWLVYLFQDVLLIYFLNTTRFNLSPRVDLVLAIENCFVILLPKLFFTYFMLYITLDKIGKAGIQKKDILFSIFALAAALFLYRGLVIYFVDPVINGMTNILPFFYPLGFLVALMDIGFASGAAIVIKQVRLQLTGKEKEKNLIKEKLEAELKFLRNQTHPHFLFNTLNNIYALARKKSDETPEVVMKLSKLLRFMLYETSKPFIKIGDEIKMLDDYIELERIRYDGRLTINFLREIDNESEQISPLLLLPFVENAFKHGASESRFESYIHIDMKLENSLLHFNIENTKENNPKSDVNENIGLKNVKRQLELMYKDYNMLVKSELSLFKVCLTINLKTNAEV